MERPKLSIIIPTYNRSKDISNLLKSIVSSKFAAEKLEVIVIDNANESALEKLLQKIIPSVKIIKPAANLYSNGARKIGASLAKGKFIFFLDDDNTLEKNCIQTLVSALEKNPKLGAVGPLMLENDSDLIWCAGARLSSFGLPYYLHQGERLNEDRLPDLIHGVDYFPNACMVRSTILTKVPFDDYFPHNWAETDFCLRIKSRGYELVCVTSALEWHHIGYTGRLTRLGIDKTYDQAKSRILFRKRHLPSFLDWIKFWIIVFPSSSILYLSKIMGSEKDKIEMLKAYIKGTLEGISEPLKTTLN